MPQVVVMGTSTASNSEATINTSTESASTLVTNITSNTDTETNDSIDLGEHSGQSEPLLSSLDEPSNSISSQISPNLLRSRASDQESLLDNPCTVYYQKRSLKHHHQPSSSISEDDDLIEITGLDQLHSRTAPVANANRFPFDMPTSPRSGGRTYGKSPSKFTFDNHQEVSRRSSSSKFAVDSSSSSSSSPSSASTNTVTIIGSKETADLEQRGRSNKENQRFGSAAGKLIKTGDGLTRVVLRDKLTSKKRINSAPIVPCNAANNPNNNHNNKGVVASDSTMFPFDREAIDYDRIQRECFAVEEEIKFPFDLDTDPDSPIYDKASIFQSPSKQSYKNASYFGESNELLERYNYAEKNRDDIFRQYAFLSQQEKNKTSSTSTKERSERRSPNLKRSKYQSRKTDAFTPQTNTQNKASHHSSASNLQNLHHHHNSNNEISSGESSSASATSILKFDQINSKFEQIPPNQKLNTSWSKLSPTAIPGDKSPTNATTMVRITPPLPDLRVDFFQSQPSQEEPPHHHQQHHQHQHQYQHHHHHSAKYRGASARDDNSAEHDNNDAILDACQKNAQQLGSINVTANPMDGPVCAQPRATIVVQQV